MSLATSCPSCGTVFKVVEDQLKVSEGWVRCGHCHDVFNALEGLFDLERRDSLFQGLRTLPAPLDEAPQVAAAPVGPLNVEASGSSSAEDSTHGATLDAAVDHGSQAVSVQNQEPGADDHVSRAEPVHGTLRAETSNSIASTSNEAIGADFIDLGVSAPPDGARLGTWHERSSLVATVSNVELGAAPPPVVAPAAEATALLDTSAGTPGITPTVDIAPETLTPSLDVPSLSQFGSENFVEDPQPEFVLDADRRAWWGSTKVRWAAGTSSAALFVVLIGQVLWHERDYLAATCDVCAAPLRTVSSAIGMPLQPPAVLNMVEVDNATLVHPAGVEGFRLSVLVRNHAAHTLASPHMELSLTDANAGLLSRRLLSPEDFQQQPGLPPNGDVAWNLEFETAEKKIAGYTVTAVYP